MLCRDATVAWQEAAMEVSSPLVSTKRVLFATDFSDRATAALPYALSLARKPGGRLLVVHVVSMGPLGAGFPAHAWLVTTAQGVREAQASMHRMEGQLSGVEHHSVVRSGDVLSEMDALVASEGIDVMVLGTHGRTGIGKAMFGSVAEKLFRHARCPVLTIGPNVRSDPERVEDLHGILYPTDFSEESRPALAYATSLAQDHGARLYLLHVTNGEVGSDRHYVEEKLRAMLAPAAHFDCEPKALVEQGLPGQAIVDVAQELAADLIVIGPKRRSGMPGTMATTYRVVTQAACPVLTVRG
jgi:nucleotide-binding universal stress UspA family protein